MTTQAPALRVQMDEMGDEHVMTSVATPLRTDAFDKSDEQKIDEIADKFASIMEILGLDLTDDSLAGTPYRVAKMYVKEIFSGLHPDRKPEVKLFDNTYGYDGMLVEKGISFYSNCEHHFVPIIGKAHVAYISNGKVIGLSKLNRIVRYYAARPTVQERLTMQIAEDLKAALQTDDIAVYIDAVHLCVSSRGVKDTASSTVTSHFAGKFLESEYKNQFLQSIQNA
jgi:GTP cyclohydrolase I